MLQTVQDLQTCPSRRCMQQLCHCLLFTLRWPQKIPQRWMQSLALQTAMIRHQAAVQLCSCHRT